MAVFPADIVAEILSRLPVKALLRFRSVCKIWCALIGSDHFIKLHLHRSIDAKNHRQIVLTRCGTKNHHLLSLDSLVVAGKLECPLWPEGEGLLALSSSNGLIMLWTYGGHRDTVVIFNPSTRKCQKLPPFPLKSYGSISTKDSESSVRFGYDEVNDDYKVFKLDQFKYSRGFKWEIQVYSLKSNTWWTIKDFPYFPCSKGQDGEIAHGAIHWFVDINEDEAHPRHSIAAFDIATEETRLVSLPDFVSVKDVYMDLVTLEGCLCIVVYKRNLFLGVWVMKDYGVGESWNQLLSPAQLSVMGSFCRVFPLAYSKNGCKVLLLQVDKEFIWFYLEHNAVRKIKFQGLPSYFQAKVYVQSLLPEENISQRSSVYEIRRL